MEQLGNIILNFEALVDEGVGTPIPFTLRISEPQFEEDGTAYCRIDCPYLRAKPFLIFGVDEEQSIELAITFVRKSIDAKNAKLTDENGAETAIPEIDTKGFKFGKEP
jgi:hypothetical protein